MLRPTRTPTPTPTPTRPDIHLPYSGKAFVNDVRGLAAAGPLESPTDAHVTRQVPRALSLRTSRITTFAVVTSGGHLIWRSLAINAPRFYSLFCSQYQNLISANVGRFSRCWNAIYSDRSRRCAQLGFGSKCWCNESCVIRIKRIDWIPYRKPCVRVTDICRVRLSTFFDYSQSTASERYRWNWK